MSNNTYYNDQWRIINEPNQNKVSNYSMEKTTTNSKILSADSTVNGSSSISVSTWFKSTSTTNSRYIWSFPNTDGGDGFNLRTAGAGSQLSMLVKDAGAFLSDTFNWSDGNWHHIVVTYDGSTLKFYTDGSLNSSHSFVTTISNALNEFYVGAFSASFLTLGAFGSYDQTCIFNYALPATGTNSVATLYGGGTAVTNPMALSPKPIAYYQLGDQSVDNGANYIVPNNSLQDYVFDYGFTSGNSYTAIQTNDLSSLSAISISTWFKYNSGIASFSNLFKLEGNIALLNWTSTAQIRFQGSGGSSDRHIINTTFEADRWYNLTLTYSGTSAKCYIDGDISKGFDVTAGNLALTSSQNKFNIGSSTSNSNRWDGFISNTSMFNYELTNSQAFLIYNNGTPSDLTSLSPIGWWKQNSNDIFITNTIGSVNFTIIDYGSDSNNGSMVNAVSGSLQQGNLQHTSGYSPYALSLDGTNDQINCGNNSGFTFGNGTTDSPFSVSFWINPNSISTGTKGYFQKGTDSLFEYGILFYLNKIRFRLYGGTQISIDEAGATALVANSWNQVILTYDGTGGSTAANGMEMYINGSLITVTRSNSGSYVAMSNRGSDLFIGSRGGVGYVAAEFSNFAVFNTELTSTEVTEVYNQGVPSNLNTFSGTKPTAWWQLGSNSSFNTNWTCLNEGSVTGSNAVSVNMTNDDITNGVGYSANGLGTSSIDIKGDAPYSTNNGLSENMDVLDRTTDVPS